MKEQFIEKKFREDTLLMIGMLAAILDEYDREGYQLTVRQLYYQMVARGHIPNTQKSYARLASVVNDARMAGLLDWDLIVDRGRRTTRNAHWGTPWDILDSCVDSFCIDKWKHQPIHIEIMVEKQALEGVLEPAAHKWDLPFTANKGYSSQSYMHSKGVALRRVLHEHQRDVHILYLGDHDPSGLDMDRDIAERLSLFSHAAMGSAQLYVRRLALTMKQIDRYNPPPNPAKVTDSRADAYIDRHGTSSWELDALEPRTLVRLVDDAVEELLDLHGDRRIWDRTHEIEEEMRDELRELRDGVNSDEWLVKLRHMRTDHGV